MNERNNKEQDKINLDFDWNSEYGDGDIPDIDKNSARSKSRNQAKQNKTK